jgi:hypothetical protein
VRALPVIPLILFDVCEPLFQATLAVGDAPPRIFLRIAAIASASFANGS